VQPCRGEPYGHGMLFRFSLHRIDSRQIQLPGWNSVISADQYLSAAVALVVSVVLSAGLTPAIRAVAVRFRLLDHAITARKIHGQPVPRLGGLAIVVAFFGALGAARQLGPLGFEERTLALLLGALAIALL